MWEARTSYRRMIQKVNERIRVHSPTACRTQDLQFGTLNRSLMLFEVLLASHYLFLTIFSKAVISLKVTWAHTQYGPNIWISISINAKVF